MKRVYAILSLVLLLMLSACESSDVVVGESSEIAFNAKHMQRGAMTQADIDNSRVYIYGVQNNTNRIYIKIF